MRECGVVECMEGNEFEIWEGMEGVVWCGVGEKSRCRGKEGCAFLSPGVWKGREAHGWKE